MSKGMKKIAGFLAFVLLVSFSTSSFASAITTETHNFEDLSLEDFDSFEDIPLELLKPDYYSEDEIFYIPREYLDPYHPDTIKY